MRKGISIVICCYNSSKLLPETLKYVSRLRKTDIACEVIIIDNASDDPTTEIAKLLLDEKFPIPHKILFQKEKGLSFARKMGFENSNYEYILFCDDDNWLNDDYLGISFRIMEGNPDIGVLGGETEAVFEHEPPEWFPVFAQNYCVGRQSDAAGDITWDTGVLWGAGMIVRKQALEELFSKGFQSLLIDRKGNTLSSGGDSELCYALRLAGWKIWYDPGLRLKHFISSDKLNWNYLRKLNRGFGAQKINFDPYLKAFDAEPKTLRENYIRKWQYESARLLKKLRSYGLRKLLKYYKPSEGDPDILRIEKYWGRLNEILKIRSKYDERLKLIRTASWRKSS